MNQIRQVILVSFFLIPLIGKCQVIDSSETSLVKVQTFTFRSQILNEDRKIYLYHPKEDSLYLSQSSYPVLYLMDAEEQLGMTTGQVIYLSGSYSILPPIILVGIGNIDRTKDLTPTHSTTGNNGRADTSMAATLRTSSNGEKFLQFIRDELIPFVEQRYSTSPFKVFSGHSLGGLMSVYALLKHTDMFNAYIAISPSLWWDEQYVIKMAKSWKPVLKTKKLLFVSDGSEGGQFHKDAVNLTSILKSKKLTQLAIKYTHYPDEPHPAEPVKAIYDALRHIFQPVYPPQFDTLSSFIYFKPEMITQYYDNLSSRSGYEIKPPEGVVDRLAHHLLSLNTKQGRQDAFSLLELNISNYPLSWHSYFSLGKMHQTLLNKKPAMDLYKKALKINPRNHMITKAIQDISD